MLESIEWKETVGIEVVGGFSSICRRHRSNTWDQVSLEFMHETNILAFIKNIKLNFAACDVCHV